MKRITQFVCALCLGIWLSGSFTVYDAPGRAVPSVEPPSFSRTAHAAFWDGWFAEAPTVLSFGEMYGSASSLGIKFSEKLVGCEGRRVSMSGFMAPPLKPTIHFFVLAREPMSICPFCSSDTDWPTDIVVVKLSEPVTSLPFDHPIRVTGQLELGTKADAETGFVSLVRIQVDTLEEI